MPYVPIEALTKKNPSMFKLVLAAAQRANEINDGAPSAAQGASKNHATLSLLEFSAGKVYYEEVAQPVVQPPVSQVTDEESKEEG